jgi:hypothetical protein
MKNYPVESRRNGISHKKWNIPQKMKRSKANSFGHSLCSKSLLNQVIGGK